MGTKGLIKCCGCGGWFSPAGRNVWHQKYCGKPACRLASKQASQRKWRRKNRDYFRGALHVRRVQAWRARHPGYWRKPEVRPAEAPPDALQDLLVGQGFGVEGVKVLRNCLQEEISRPLQDLLEAQVHVVKGLAVMLLGDALQDDIARVLTGCYEAGRRVGGMVPLMPSQEPANEKTRVDRRAPSSAHSLPFQLGGPPPGS